MWKPIRVLKQAVSEFLADGCMSSGAAIAYYSIFSLPPLAMMVYLSLGYTGVSHERIHEAIKKRLGFPSAAAQATSDKADNPDGPGNSAENRPGVAIGDLAERARSGRSGGVGSLGGVVSILILVFTATGLFGELQLALNRAWGVKPDPNQGGVRRFLLKRLFSLGLIFAMVLLLILSMLMSALLQELYGLVQGAVPSRVDLIVTNVFDNIVTFAVATLLFAAVFKILPDADMQWRDVWVGAGSTALLFVLGKAVVAWYLQRANLGSSWGDATGSMVAMLAWLYYTSLIVLLGAEFTQVWAQEYGAGFRAAAGAHRAGKASTRPDETTAESEQ